MRKVLIRPVSCRVSEVMVGNLREEYGHWGLKNDVRDECRPVPNWKKSGTSFED